MATKTSENPRLISAWVPAALSVRLQELARDRERSLSAELLLAVREHLKREQEKKRA